MLLARLLARSRRGGYFCLVSFFFVNFFPPSWTRIQSRGVRSQPHTEGEALLPSILHQYHINTTINTTINTAISTTSTTTTTTTTTTTNNNNTSGSSQNLAGRVGLGQEVFDFSRDVTGRVGSGRVGSGRVGSGRAGPGRVGRFSNLAGWDGLPRFDMTHEKP